MTIGAEIKNDRVTPRGTPAVTNLMSKGKEEQEALRDLNRWQG